VQARQVALEGVGKEGGDVPGRAAGAAAALFHLVFAGIRVRSQVADVGDVDDVPHVDAVQLQHAPQGIAEQIGAQVADVGVVVDGRAAGVQASAAAFQRFERAQAALVSVVQHQRHEGLQKRQRPQEKDSRAACRNYGCENAIG
jgi:hypothetical protein